MYSLVKTPEKWHYMFDVWATKEMIVITADMVNKSWSFSLKSGKLYAEFLDEIRGIESREITEDKFNEAKLKYKEYSIKNK